MNAGVESAVREIIYKRPWLYPLQEHAIFYPRDAQGHDARYSLIEASTKTGKTVGCIAWLWELAFVTGKRGRNYWWIAPVYGQAKIAFTRMKAAYPQDSYVSNEGDLTITMPHNGAVIWFKSAEKADNLYGEDVWGAVYDEASRGREESWHALRSTITATRAPVRFIGNVKGRKNWFYALCRKAEGGEQGMAYFKIVANDAVHAGILDADEISSAKRDLPDHVFKELYLAEPSDDGGNPFGIKHIQACIAPLSSKPVKAWGWDLAKSHDWTVGIGLDAEGSVARIERWQGPWEDTITKIDSMCGRLIPTLIDSTGVGDPIVERLQKGRSNIAGYHFTSPSKQKIMEGLSVAIQSKKTSVIEGVHKNELESFEYEYTRTGVRYSAPEGFHDDVVCAHALAVAIHVRKSANLSVWEKLAS